ncbi:MAG: mannose-6-phosphate isomerase [Opitutus sp.]|nr:mannose-6-phosphate isomerase [Opitutus sp.]
MSFFQFIPLYQERVWGGRALADRLGRALPGSGPVGESWEIVDRPEAQSVVVPGGRHEGLTLRELIATRAPEIMGPHWSPERRFPILVKWLDCRERLSLQVHPPASIAAALGGEPKTENWFIAHAEPGAAVLAGLQPGVDAARFRAALADNSAESLVLRHETRTGDSILIRSGVMHAIDGGNLILEIQQNSDTTYRCYDWGRMGTDGRPRQLHLEQSLACLSANTAPTPPIVRSAGSDAVLADCAEFRLRRVRLAADETLHFRAREQPRILSVLSGRLAIDGGRPLGRGDNILLPYAEDFAFTATDGCAVLVTENFDRS